jgi:dienelactone hydrolase
MKSMFLLTIVTVFSLAAFAAGGKSVSYKSGEETVQAMLYTPAGKGPFPGIVVIHEWWGLNDWVKEQASKLADQGYAALAIDLYRGKVGDYTRSGARTHAWGCGGPRGSRSARCRRVSQITKERK